MPSRGRVDTAPPAPARAFDGAHAASTPRSDARARWTTRCRARRCWSRTRSSPTAARSISSMPRSALHAHLPRVHGAPPRPRLPVGRGVPGARRRDRPLSLPPLPERQAEAAFRRPRELQQTARERRRIPRAARLREGDRNAHAAPARARAARPIDAAPPDPRRLSHDRRLRAALCARGTRQPRLPRRRHFRLRRADPRRVARVGQLAHLLPRTTRRRGTPRPEWARHAGRRAMPPPGRLPGDPLRFGPPPLGARRARRRRAPPTHERHATHRERRLASRRRRCAGDRARGADRFSRPTTRPDRAGRRPRRPPASRAAPVARPSRQPCA